MRAISSQIEIETPIDQVWGILVDLDQYEKWNPFTVKVESTLQTGTQAVLHVQMSRTKKIVQVETVTACDAPTMLSWGMTMGMPWILKAHRTQELTDLGEGRTRYTTRDVFSGALTPLVFSLYAKHIQRGFDGIAASLKKRAESQTK